MPNCTLLIGRLLRPASHITSANDEAENYNSENYNSTRFDGGGAFTKQQWSFLEKQCSRLSDARTVV